MTRRAALPMYDWPEVRAETLAFWDRVRDGLDLPALTHPVEGDHLLSIWRDPDTVIADSCWGMVDLGLIGTQRRLAQRSYRGVPGGSDTHYRSALIARQGRAACPGPHAVMPAGMDRMRWAANSDESRSGWLAIAEDAGLSDAGVVWTGTHRASIRAVADGGADVAAIDCRSWQLALAHEPAARGLTVVGWTAPRLGSFFMTGTNMPDDTAEAVSRALIANGQFAL